MSRFPVTVTQGKSTTPAQRFNRRKLQLLKEALELENSGNAFQARAKRRQAQVMAQHSKRAKSDPNYGVTPINVKVAV